MATAAQLGKATVFYGRRYRLSRPTRSSIDDD
jgi:hypothetical protein